MSAAAAGVTTPDNDHKKAARAAAVAAAGIPADRHDAVLEELDWIFECHHFWAAVPDQSPTYLDGIIEAATAVGDRIASGTPDTAVRWAEKLRDRIHNLPKGLLFSIYEYQGFRDGEYLADSLPLDTLIQRATEVRERLGGNRGRPTAASKPLLFQLLLIWEREMPSQRGVTKPRRNGAELYAGPLLTLVTDLFRIEGIRNACVGEPLYRMVLDQIEMDKDL